MKMRTRPARSTTATVIGTLIFAHSSIAPSARAKPNFQVMSRCAFREVSATRPSFQQIPNPLARKPRRLRRRRVDLGELVAPVPRPAGVDDRPAVGEVALGLA